MLDVAGRLTSVRNPPARIRPGLGYDQHMNAREARLAEAVRQACLTAAIEAAERAGTSGLCADGRLEAAIDAIRGLQIENVDALSDAGERHGTGHN
jgi:hypothetical protein